LDVFVRGKEYADETLPVYPSFAVPAEALPDPDGSVDVVCEFGQPCRHGQPIRNAVVREMLRVGQQGRDF